jgi:hypothetical protein
MDLDLIGVTAASINALRVMRPCLNVRPPARRPRSGAPAMIRLRAEISYALTEAMGEGHCGLPTDQLIPLAEDCSKPRRN